LRESGGPLSTEALLGSVRMRLQSLNDGNASGVTAREAAEEARELVRRSVRVPALRAEAFELAGWLLWYRCMVAAGEPDHDELALATQVLLHLHLAGGRVPPAIEELYAASGNDLDAALARLPDYHYDRGVFQFTRFEHTGDQRLLFDAARSMRTARHHFPKSGASRYESCSTWAPCCGISISRRTISKRPSTRWRPCVKRP